MRIKTTVQLPSSRPWTCITGPSMLAESARPPSSYLGPVAHPPSRTANAAINSSPLKGTFMSAKSGGCRLQGCCPNGRYCIKHPESQSKARRRTIGLIPEVKGNCFPVRVRAYSLCADVPSDHRPTGTKKIISGSGTSVNSSLNKTGDPGRFAPQLDPSVFGM